MKFFNKNYILRDFFVFWTGQFISTFGSSMTGFAISIWAFEKTGSALVLSFSTILIIFPKIFINIIAGPLVDKINKKHIILLMDILSGVSTGILFFVLYKGKLEIWHIYLLNMFNGIFSCIQNLASEVTISEIVPKNYYTRISGFQSFSDGIIRILPPILAAIIFETGGISTVVFIDFITMVAACVTLVLFVRIPFERNKVKKENKEKKNFKESIPGIMFIIKNKLLRTLILFFLFIDFVSGITYVNLITPMILARSGNNATILSLVRSGMGIGNILGGFVTAVIRIPKSKSKTNIIFICCLASFLGGDLLLGIGPNPLLWIIGGFLGNVFTPMAMANQSYFWRTIVPINLQGRVFSCKAAISNVSRIIGIFLGGFLADYIFEPLMINSNNIMTNILGSKKGSGMALMFAITGILGMIINVLGIRDKGIKEIERENCR